MNLMNRTNLITALGFSVSLSVGAESVGFNALLSKYKGSSTDAPPATPPKKKRSIAAVNDTKNVPEKSPTPEAALPGPTFGLSGDWAGLRRTLYDVGVEFEGVYKGEWVSISNKGIGSKGGYLGNIDLRAKVDADKAFGVKGLRFLVYGLGDHGFKPAQYVGDAQGTSSIEGPSTFKLYELYAEQVFLEGKASVLLGLHDLNTEFYVTDSAGIYRNSSFGLGKEFAQSGENGPSIFPEPSAALRLKVNPTPETYLLNAIFDGVPGNPPNHMGTNFSLKAADGWLFVTEVGYLRAAPEGASLATSKYAFGTWNYTSTFDHANGTDKTGNHGFYLLFDQYLFRGTSAFVRHGWSVGDVADKSFASCTTFGINVRGLIPSRDSDRLGLGVAMANTTDGARASGLENRETAFEVVYRAEIQNGIALIPDFQYVVNPGATSNGNSSVLALRFEVSL